LDVREGGSTDRSPTTTRRLGGREFLQTVNLMHSYLSPRPGKEGYQRWSPGFQLPEGLPAATGGPRRGAVEWNVKSTCDAVGRAHSRILGASGAGGHRSFDGA